ncbi:hypothetical protein DPMN_148658 [Dreissena polymorpha]|uniref:Uncharacterized protein n=1 Tax=Dreissena polymorpha TaxID=45954 RepID=A0A9D4FAD2_DREPO|nr:hypothetical protein DPMN_148658 [Dreissena polymorpha]
MYKPTPSAKLLRFKARSMLVDGSMPLFPSAKRDWATVEEESILLPNLLWPPRLGEDSPLISVFRLWNSPACPLHRLKTILHSFFQSDRS